MFLALKFVEREAMRINSKKKKKKEKNSFSAYEELRVYKRHNITKALIESLMLRRGNKTLGGGGSGCELN